MASSSRVSSWRVTYASLSIPGDCRSSPFLDGVLVVHHASRRLLLLDDKERIRDSRLLRADEVIELGGAVMFLRHDARIPVRPLPPESLFKHDGGDSPSVARRGSSCAVDFQVGFRLLPTVSRLAVGWEKSPEIAVPSRRWRLPHDPYHIRLGLVRLRWEIVAEGVAELVEGGEGSALVEVGVGLLLEALVEVDSAVPGITSGSVTSRRGLARTPPPLVAASERLMSTVMQLFKVGVVTKLQIARYPLIDLSGVKGGMILVLVQIAMLLDTLLLTVRLFVVLAVSPGQGFFYFPDSSSPQQVKEKASTVIITVKEGNVLARDIEKEFNEGGFFGPGWRCTARPLSPMQFSMRFPSQKEVERACCWGNELKMRTKNAILKLSPWSDDVGASSKLQKAWVRVRNIPPKKRNEAHAAYAGSLVGVTLDIDKFTLHRPEYVRILIGCRDISKIPDRAEGCLGDNFYWFYYEVDKVVRSGSTSYGKTYASTLEVVSEHESEDENEGEGDLLIEEIIQDKIAEIDSNVMNPMGDTAAHPTEASVIPSEGAVIDIPEHSAIPEEQVTETQDKMSKEQNGMNSLHVSERKKCDMVVAEKVVGG
ncbi:hypothetical protein ACQ4PT_066581 [Festuca glaucescens]